MNSYKSRLVALAGVICLAVVLVAIPQVKQPGHVEVAPISPRPEDVSCIDNIVKASHETISGGVGVPRQWGRDRSLYDPNIRFVSIRVDPKTDAVITRSESHQDFVDTADEFMPLRPELQPDKSLASP
jgi:hypothetical protein